MASRAPALEILQPDRPNCRVPGVKAIAFHGGGRSRSSFEDHYLQDVPPAPSHGAGPRVEIRCDRQAETVRQVAGKIGPDQSPGLAKKRSLASVRSRPIPEDDLGIDERGSRILFD